MKTNFLNTRNLVNTIWRYTAMLGLCLCGTVAAVAGVSYAGFYSGTYQTTSGTSDNGNMAWFVDAGGTGALVIESLAGNGGGGGFEENIPVSSSGTIINYTGPDGTVINASISGGTLTGTWSSSDNGGSFTCTARSTSGSYQSSAGYYSGTATNSNGSADGYLRIILAPDGTFYGGEQDIQDQYGDGFTGTMSGNSLSITSSGGTSGHGTLNTTSFLFVGNYSSPGGSGTFTLPRIDTVTGSSLLATPWPDATDLGNGWRNSSWFGKFNVNSYPWIYHAQHGWLYVFGTDPTSIWLYSPGMGFLWTGSGVYPWLWSDTQQTWLYYDVGSSNPRWFYNWNQQKWTKVNP